MIITLGGISITVLLTIVVLLGTFKYSRLKPKPTTFACFRIAVLLFATMYIAALCLTPYLVGDQHIYNIAIFVSMLLALELIRLFLDCWECVVDQNGNLKGSVGVQLRIRDRVTDFWGNSICFVIPYLLFSTINTDSLLICGVLLTILTLIRTFKYRIYDDYVRIVNGEGFACKKPNYATFIQGIGNVVFRGYLFVATSFALLYLCLLGGNPNQKTIMITNSSGDLFIDLFYFSIVTTSTVGFGDIQPVSKAAKILCSGHIVTGYLFLALVITATISRLPFGDGSGRIQ